MMETILFIAAAVLTFTATEVAYQIGIRNRRRHAIQGGK